MVPTKPTSVWSPKLAEKRVLRSACVEFSIMKGALETIASDWAMPKPMTESCSQTGPGAKTMPSVAAVRITPANTIDFLRPMWSTRTPAGIVPINAMRFGSDWSEPRKLRE